MRPSAAHAKIISPFPKRLLDSALSRTHALVVVIVYSVVLAATTLSLFQIGDATSATGG